MSTTYAAPFHVRAAGASSCPLPFVYLLPSSETGRSNVVSASRSPVSPTGRLDCGLPSFHATLRLSNPVLAYRKCHRRRLSQYVGLSGSCKRISILNSGPTDTLPTSDVMSTTILSLSYPHTPRPVFGRLTPFRDVHFMCRSQALCVSSELFHFDSLDFLISRRFSRFPAIFESGRSSPYPSFHSTLRASR